MASSFFDYFPVAPQARSWGLHATSFGHVKVPPHAAYPPSRHPEGHHFAWSEGRTLHDYQLLYVRSGGGYFESALTKRRKISRGMMFLLFPGVWHRYCPQAATGWTESWIEFNGAYLDHLRGSGIIDPRHPVHRAAEADEIGDLFAEARRLVLAKPPGFSVRLGLLAAQILTLFLSRSARRQAAPRRMERIVSKSQSLLADSLDRPVSVEEIARQLGVGYSYFRREFRRQTGFSPKQYQIEIRHRRARDLLRGTSLAIKEISERLGYHSPYHLSLDFSKRAGTPPTQWRRARAKERG